MTVSGEVWCLVLVDAGSEIPVATRMKAMLKRAGRDWKMRCMSVSDRTAEQALEASRAEVLRLEAEVERLRKRLAKRQARRGQLADSH